MRGINLLFEFWKNHDTIFQNSKVKVLNIKKSINFEFVLFSIDPVMIQTALKAGIETALVDWEWVGKAKRQIDADTEINRHTYGDLHHVTNESDSHVICRINSFGEKTPHEIEMAIQGGADEILLPMVRSVQEVERVLALADGKIDVGILIETLAAIDIAPDLGDLPLSRAYVGLNDLSIERNSAHIFEPLIDGTIEKIREFFSMPFGFGGITVLGKGYPVPFELLLREMIRLDCQFSFLRRSFYRDIQGKNLSDEILRIVEMIQQLQKRNFKEIENDHEKLTGVLSSLSCV